MKLGQRIRTEVNGTVQLCTVVGRTFDNDGTVTALILETPNFGRYTIPATQGGKA